MRLSVACEYKVNEQSTWSAAAAVILSRACGLRNIPVSSIFLSLSPDVKSLFCGGTGWTLDLQQQKGRTD